MSYFIYFSVPFLMKSGDSSRIETLKCKHKIRKRTLWWAHFESLMKIKNNPEYSNNLLENHRNSYCVTTFLFYSNSRSWYCKQGPRDCYTCNKIEKLPKMWQRTLTIEFKYGCKYWSRKRLPWQLITQKIQNNLDIR